MTIMSPEPDGASNVVRRRSVLGSIAALSALACITPIVAAPKAAGAQAGGPLSKFFVDGKPASPDTVERFAFAGYAHFTNIQVRHGRVKGIDTHLDRLRDASEKLFGRANSDEEVRSYMRATLRGSEPAVTLRVTACSPDGDYTTTHPKPIIVTRLGPPAPALSNGLAMTTYEYERFLPELKLVGDPAKTYYLRKAADEGYDDAVLVDHFGRLVCGTIWNLAFWKDDSVIWPEGDILLGTTMRMVRRQLRTLGVPQRVEPVHLIDVGRYDGAVVMNSWSPGVAIRAIGDTPISYSPEFVDVLHRAFAREEWAMV